MVKKGVGLIRVLEAEVKMGGFQSEMCPSWDNAFPPDSWPYLKSFSLCLMDTQCS